MVVNAFAQQLALFQIGLPLLLIILNAAIPSASSTGFLLRFAAIGIALIYLALAGLWLFEPWWTPLILGVLHGVATLLAVRRLRTSGRRPSRWAQLGEIGVSVAAVGAALVLLYPAMSGRYAPNAPVDLASPLEPGHYLVANGGTTTAINAHLLFQDPERFAAYSGQARAIDIIGTDRWGFSTTGLSPEDPERYAIYGRHILAPCAGEIVRAFDDAPDMRVPVMDRSNMAGNHVFIACGEWIVVLGHMAPGSVQVAVGDRVSTGERIGRVGNSGNTNAPHLHLHVQRGSPANTPLGGEPVWFTIDGQFPVRNDRIRITN